MANLSRLGLVEALLLTGVLVSVLSYWAFSFVEFIYVASFLMFAAFIVWVKINAKSDKQVFY